jgi:hypothetical protein
MSQQFPKPWVIRVVGPKQEMEYFLILSSAPAPAKEKVIKFLKVRNRQDWKVEEPAEPKQL